MLKSVGDILIYNYQLMTKQIYIDYLTAYCTQLDISEGCYFNTFKAPHLSGDQQKEHLLNQLIDLQNYTGVFEWNYTPKVKGWHVHTLSKEPQHNAQHTCLIYDLQGLIQYLAKQAFKIDQPILFNQEPLQQLTIDFNAHDGIDEVQTVQHQPTNKRTLTALYFWFYRLFIIEPQKRKEIDLQNYTRIKERTLYQPLPIDDT